MPLVTARYTTAVAAVVVPALQHAVAVVHAASAILLQLRTAQGNNGDPFSNYRDIKGGFSMKI